MLFSITATATESLIKDKSVNIVVAQQQVDALRKVAVSDVQRARVAQLEQALQRRQNKN